MKEAAKAGDLSGAEPNGSGLAIFEDVVPRQFLDEINAAIEATRESWPAAHGGPKLALADAAAKLLRGNKAFNAVEKRTCGEVRAWIRNQSGLSLTNESIASLRCVDGRMQWQSHLRHFDSHLLTLLIPLQLAPGDEQNGDLLLYVKPRKYSSLLSHLVRKVWLVLQQNRSYKARERRTARDLAAGKCRRVPVTPGNVYAFNGFVTLHANLHVGSGERRTLILHYFDVRLTAGVKNVTLLVNNWRDRVMRLGAQLTSRASE